MKHLLPGVLTLLVAASPAVGAPARNVSKTLPLAEGGRVTVDTYKGSIRVTPWDRAEVAVEARIAPDDSCGSERDQKKWMDATRVVVEPAGGGVRITSDYDKLDWSWNFFGACTSRPFVHYRISVPRAAALKIHDYKSDTDVKDFAGHLTLETYKGSVTLTGLSGPLDLETYKGEIRAGFERLSGDVSVETYKGDVVLTIPSKSGFELKANAGRRGEIVSDFEGTGAVRSSRRSGLRSSATVNGGGPRVTLSTEKGRFAIRGR
jgi:Putative adhesin